MNNSIQPTYYPDAQVICACGNTWNTGSTRKTIRTDVCSKCHPFFTGEQRIVDTEGQVDRFYKKLQARETFRKDQEARVAAKNPAERSVSELELSARASEALSAAGVLTVGQAVQKFSEGGEEALLAIDGFGRKALADLKKRLRAMGYELPEAEAQA